EITSNQVESTITDPDRSSITTVILINSPLEQNNDLYTYMKKLIKTSILLFNDIKECINDINEKKNQYRLIYLILFIDDTVTKQELEHLIELYSNSETVHAIYIKLHDKTIITNKEFLNRFPKIAGIFQSNNSLVSQSLNDMGNYYTDIADNYIEQGDTVLAQVYYKKGIELFTEMTQFLQTKRKLTRK
ncbi:unnamed protein product, partial [Didymodactylos carnosus]